METKGKQKTPGYDTIEIETIKNISEELASLLTHLNEQLLNQYSRKEIVY